MEDEERNAVIGLHRRWNLLYSVKLLKNSSIAIALGLNLVKFLSKNEETEKGLFS
ncbi:hypothetical protein [Halotia branconii]|uniref:Uncharacterized protein n=1 Tax=Halotia branconii CENA392 TaxID=1539056 RepID=A0AAJ6P7N7_9CYAN|nr:hypothetical protein [Halotia branconii]WGV23816.1 hypothetical protein QI031_18605 [Halotia branconii CENA392]